MNYYIFTSYLFFSYIMARAKYSRELIPLLTVRDIGVSNLFLASNDDAPASSPLVISASSDGATPTFDATR